jgi:VIT1/CCC1 family predicted Fe2+/Mn2+ transporter
MPTVADPKRARRYQELYEDEIAGATLYRSLASAEQDVRRQEILLKLAAAEERHSAHWARLLREAGGEPRPARIPFRVHALGWLARRFGTTAVLPLVLRLEAADADKYERIAEASAAMPAEERAHGRVVAAMRDTSAGMGIARSEGRHRVGAGGALRAVVFGLNDGLVSNLSLVMGVAGGTSNAHIVLLAGIAGMVAGALSMAMGEFVSVSSQRHLYEREIAIEREELEAFPGEEQEELALIYQAKGIEPRAAELLAQRMMLRPDAALDTLAREELGLDPGELGSPWIASSSSFISFALGAFIPVIPFLFTAGGAAIGIAAALSGVTLMVAGILISIFTGRSAAFSATRMVALGATAAAATFGIGKLIGVNIS